MPRLLRFFWQMPDTPYTTAEWLCAPFVLVGHVILGFPFFIYVVLGMQSRAQNKFHAELEQRARREWEQREAMLRRGRVITGAESNRLPDPSRGCFLWHLHHGQLWWVDAEPAALSPLSRNSPLLEDPHAHGRNLYLKLMDEEQGQAWLLEFSTHAASVEYQDRIPPGRLLYISESPFNEQGPALMCVTPMTSEETAEIFPEAESTYVSNREQKPFWGRYWKFMGMGYLGFSLLIILPLLPLVAVSSPGLWLSVAGLWLLADIMLSMLLGAWGSRNDFSMQQERSWWRKILRWVMPSLSVLYLYGFGLLLCDEAGCVESYLVCTVLHLAAYALWRGLLPRWYDPFAEEYDPPTVFDSDEETHALRPTES